MEIYKNLSRILDRTIGFFSPMSEAKRISARRIVQRQYAAAKTGRLDGDWMPVGGNVNDPIRSSKDIVRRRTQQMVRDFPYFARASRVCADFSIGDGIKFQSRVLQEGEERKLDRETNRKIEDAFNRWAEKADSSGKMHFYEAMHLARVTEFDEGEFLFQYNVGKRTDNAIPFSITLIDPKRLAETRISNPRENKIDMGVEIERKTGRPVAYYILDEDDLKQTTTRIPAEKIGHNFRYIGAGQIRGITPMTPVLLIANDLDEFIGAEVDAAKMAAKWLAFVTTDDIPAFQNNRGATKDSKDRTVERFENVMLEYLNNGEKVEIADPKRPNSGLEPFARFIIRMISICADVPYELLSSDYNGISFSNLRGIRNDYMKSLKPVWSRYIRHFALPITREWMDMAVMSGQLDLRNYFMDKERFQRMEWIPPGMEPVDRLRESRSNIDEIKSLLRSPQEVLAERGVDYERVLDDIAEFQKMAQDKGLTLNEALSTLNSSPNAVEDEAEKANGKALVGLKTAIKDAIFLEHEFTKDN